jgi:hypothetical protein
MVYMKNGKRYRSKAHYDKTRKGMFANMNTSRSGTSKILLIRQSTVKLF